MAVKPLVHVVDDDAGIRDSLHALLTSIGLDAACYATAQAFLAAPETIRPGCVLLDLRIPDMSGLKVQRLLRERGSMKPVIFLSGYADVEVTVRAMHDGATEFLTKPVNEERLLEKVRDAIELSRRRQAAHLRRATIQARLDLLSPRESQVLDGVVDGLANKEIASRLQISPKTVELHRSNVMTKMRAKSLAELVRLRFMIDIPSALTERDAG